MDKDEILKRMYEFRKELLDYVGERDSSTDPFAHGQAMGAYWARMQMDVILTGIKNTEEREKKEKQAVWKKLSEVKPKPGERVLFATEHGFVAEGFLGWAIGGYRPVRYDGDAGYFGSAAVGDVKWWREMPKGPETIK